MSENFIVNAEVRTAEGKGASRRLRKQNLVPAIVYGADKEPVSLQLKLNETVKHLESEAFYSHVLELNIDGSSEGVVLRDIQRHPTSQLPLHMDFQRIVKGEKLNVNVPVHFLNEKTCPGVKAGGIARHALTDIEVSCIPSKIPDFIEVDIAALDMGDQLHLSDLTFPEGVESVQLSHEHDLLVVSIDEPRAVAAESEEDEEDDAEPATEE
ncbi:MAG: 50S ribosomal protein L25/general stress protein Ctc [Pseudomonadota bacterium]|nr:50S ribosomal protein L25/general stress protein Ctc [Pseudomonadota bacterium]